MTTKIKDPREEAVKVFKLYLDSIYKSLETSAKAFDSGNIPLSLVKESHNQFYKAFKKNMLKQHD